MSYLHSAGFGLGLRTSHYEEILSENYTVPSGKPLAMLDRIRRDYPMVMHGVSLSIGTPDGPSESYLRELKSLARLAARLSSVCELAEAVLSCVKRIARRELFCR